jgi:hypothetical protein
MSPSNAYAPVRLNETPTRNGGGPAAAAVTSNARLQIKTRSNDIDPTQQSAHERKPNSLHAPMAS